MKYLGLIALAFFPLIQSVFANFEEYTAYSHLVEKHAVRELLGESSLSDSEVAETASKESLGEVRFIEDQNHLNRILRMAVEIMKNHEPNAETNPGDQRRIVNYFRLSSFVRIETFDAETNGKHHIHFSLAERYSNGENIFSDINKFKEFILGLKVEDISFIHYDHILYGKKRSQSLMVLSKEAQFWEIEIPILRTTLADLKIQRNTLQKEMERLQATINVSNPETINTHRLTQDIEELKEVHSMILVLDLRIARMEEALQGK